RHLRATSLGRTNVPIVWQHDDEIGKLVREYNHMILALQESASRLAQSEREGAWKEMAKQVAHEIKNPLTPMKLNIQRLQRAWQENSPEFESLIPRVTDLLINQIDALSQIATEFSAFATMPTGTSERVQVQEVMMQAALLFKMQSGAEINLDMPDKPLYVWIDPGHLSRVLNNLVKNALQAIPERRKGLVQLGVKESGGQVVFTVRDNGIGIPPEVQERIFTPNFSTKSSGMGLGLAIVKSIIEKVGGHISFETIPGEGSVFTFRFPRG
ncbi:MAG: ATP-binding protein, partial [Bacteroidota bacterium]|nr:ATP-binding protein [Bacteroidota bacterium]